jgi:hypothetical protein
MNDETLKLIAVPYKLRRRDNIDHRLIALKNALEIYFKRDIDKVLLNRITTNIEIHIVEYEEDKQIQIISHNLVKDIIRSCLSMSSI